MDLTPPQAVIFDWDNTLVDTWPLIMKCMNNTLEHFGLEAWPLEDIKIKIHKSLREWFPELFGDRWEEARDIYYDSYLVKYADHQLVPLPGAIETLELCKNNNLPMMIVSNKRSPTLRHELDKLGLGHYFISVVGAADAVKDKPDPAPVLLAMKPCGIALGQHVWFIGDTISDIECAHNTNSLPILYGDNKIDKAQLNHIQVANHQELMSLFNSQLNQ